MPLFPEISKGTFISRSNRFVIRCATPKGVIDAYLPNPGRLWELLLPGRTIYLVEKEPSRAGMLGHTAVAVEKEGTPVLLHTHLANVVVARLIAAGKLPGLEDARIEKAEASMGHSRFDFLLEKKSRPFFLEVKSCTLVGRRLAMFPDAVTRRGKKHLEELLDLSRRGIACGVIFLVHWPHAAFFLPDYHTDLDFAAVFKEIKGELFVKALSLEWLADLSLGNNIREISIPWKTIEHEAKDGGSYILMFHIAKDVQAVAGSLGEIHLPRGYYLYVGAAEQALAKRIEHHLRPNKVDRYPIDYIRKYAGRCLAMPIRSSVQLEHELAAAIGSIADGLISSVGSSDCGCPSHLFHFLANPLHSQSFINLLQYFRMDRLEEEILSSKDVSEA